ncbi:hypothetical protein COOONC_27332 [Cooperia oncophora]
MVEKITVNGRLTRVETKFAFIETPHGSVFCPLAAAIPSSEHVPSFLMRYNVGDIVRVVMVPQEGKNGCKWRAVKVRQLKNVLEMDNNSQRAPCMAAGPSGSNVALITDKRVVVTNVSETLAFGISDEFGSVFIPGAAFSAEEVTRLNSYLNIGDELLVSVRAQGDVNGCKWIATSATKLSKSQGPLITGCGKIVSLTKFHAIVWCPLYGEVKCTILSWIGGDGGMNAEWLDEILSIGDSVLFTAIKRDGDNEWKAVKWTARGFRIGDHRVQLADSYTQTVVSPPELSRRYIVPALGEALSEKPTLRNVLTRDDCSTLAKRTSGQTVVCALLSSTSPPTIRDDTGTTHLSTFPSEMTADEGDPCLFLFECSVVPPKCLRATPIPPELVPVMKYQLIKFREYELKSP